MKKYRNTLLVSMYILLVTLLFSGAYVIGRNEISGGTEKTETFAAAGETETETEIAEVRTPEYEVIAEDGKIIIYKCIGNIKSIVTSEKISENVFPKADIEELKKGVKFSRLESAQQMFENFVS